MSRYEYVDDIATAEGACIWLLTIDLNRQLSSIRITNNGGQSWVEHAAPSHGLAAGSRGAIQAFDQRQGLLTQYSASGPIVQQFRTNDAGASWQRFGRIDLGTWQASGSGAEPGPLTSAE